VQLSLPDPPAGWAVLSLDLRAAAAAAAPGAPPYASLKSVQLCATLTVRSAFCSDVRFGLKVGTEARVACCAQAAGCQASSRHSRQPPACCAGFTHQTHVRVSLAARRRCRARWC
jgi:hypothetical protein